MNGICPFCNIDKSLVIAHNNECFAMLDQYPVSEGHTLIIPYTHVSSYLELDEKTISAMHRLAKYVCERLNDVHKPDGYNIGFNVGVVAGQSVPHVHMHIIPRYKGDVENPRGGIRGVIPNKQNYGGE